MKYWIEVVGKKGLTQGWHRKKWKNIYGRCFFNFHLFHYCLWLSKCGKFLSSQQFPIESIIHPFNAERSNPIWNLVWNHPCHFDHNRSEMSTHTVHTWCQMDTIPFHMLPNSRSRIMFALFIIIMFFFSLLRMERCRVFVFKWSTVNVTMRDRCIISLFALRGPNGWQEK